VLVDGPPVLPPERIPDLVDAQARLRSDLAMTGIAIFLRPRVRRQLAAEIEAQFRAYRATGLPLDHVNAHHHFHLHPTVCAQMLDIGKRYGMTAPDHVFGLAWSGAMTAERIAGILRHLPDGLTEIYSHPATADSFAGAAHGYRYRDELAAPMAPDIKKLVPATGAQAGGFLDFAAA
jgi:predicted glycoside hydrolase/deacetylase ChbG (UPF0249 family)